nr:MAG TPA: hypothetical protein [Caudoviricetes sp.]
MSKIATLCELFTHINSYFHFSTIYSFCSFVRFVSVCRVVQLLAPFLKKFQFHCKIASSIFCCFHKA